MTNRTGEKSCRLDICILVLLIAALTTSVTETKAKSLYVIADMGGSPTPIHVYEVAANGTLTFQAKLYIPHYIRRAEYLAIDSDSNFLFVTFEHGDMIHFVDATALVYKGHIAVPDFPDLAGIAYDHEKNLVYCAYRNTDKLYIYHWEASTTTLKRYFRSPITLTGATALGIALDEINSLLYVANSNKKINVYHTSDWSLKETISVSRTAISIAVDTERGLVYTGGNDVGNNYLTQYNLNTRTEAEVQVEPDASVMGLAVDQASGFIYVSTGNNYKIGGDNLKVYDTSLKQIDIITDIGNPSGIAIPTEDISYNPLNLYKYIAGSVDNELAHVDIGGIITYTICFDNKDNNYTVNNVSIVDNLPDEVSFVTADGDGVFGQYDPVTHTYKWSYPFMIPGFPGDCLNLVVQVNPDTAPGKTITNSATIDSDETEPATVSVDSITEAISYNPLNLSKNILEGALEQTDISKLESMNIGDTIVYGICFDNKSNQYTVTNVSIVDTLPKEVTFVTADGDGKFGQYNPVNHTYRWFYSYLEPGFSGDCLKLVVQVNPGTSQGTTITNSVTIDSDETGTATASVDVVISQSPPEADAGLDQTVLQGTEVSLDGTGSTDADNDIVSYDWYEGATFLGSGEVIKYTFLLGTHTVRLVVTDSFGRADSDEVIINVVSHLQEYFTEQFSSYFFDLSYKTIMFTPALSGTSYNVCLQEITQLPTDPAGGTQLVLPDDGYVFISLNNQKTVSIFGSSFSGFYVGSNGYITFTEGDSNSLISLSHHFATKRISCLFNDLDPFRGGVVSWQQLSDRVVVTWADVPQYGMGYNYNTFQIEMYFDGRIQLAWLWVSAGEHIVGLSEGLGLPIDFQGTDFSEYPQCESVPPATTPIAHWTMDDNANDTTVLDSSGRGNHGTAQRNTSALSVAGIIDNALSFNGISDYISVPDNPEWTFSGDFTITVWAKFDTFNLKWWESAFIGHDEGPGYTDKWIFSYDPVDSKTLFHINHAGSKCPQCSPIISAFIKGEPWIAQAGLWYFIAVVRSDSMYSFYRQGVYDGSRIDTTVIPDAASPLTIGWAEEYATFDGALDDVRIYNEALSEEEITALFNQGAVP